jgi:hypothetical protein
MKLKTRAGSILLLVVLLSSALARPSSADGGIFGFDEETALWELQRMRQQSCYINYENGFENMLLSVLPTEFRSERGVWIFPIPAEPDKAVIDIINELPRLGSWHDEDVRTEARASVANLLSLMRLSQLYTFPVYLLSSLRAQLAQSRGLLTADFGVEVHQHIERLGLTSELITAENGSAFYSYLADKELDLPPDFRSLLDEYIGQEYSFVVSWISSVERYEEAVEQAWMYFDILGVSIRFPADRIYFPLRPTSVYGSTTIPVAVYVMGWVTPELYPEIQEDAVVKYLVETDYDVPAELSGFFNGRTSIGRLRYTKIDLDVPSESFAEDLWMKDSAPVDVVRAEYIITHSWIWAAPAFALTSCLASMLAGLIAFRKGSPSRAKLALFGLCNLWSLGFLAVATIELETKTVHSEPEAKPLRERELPWDAWDREKSLFVFLFSAFFMVFTYVLEFVLQTGLDFVL